MRSPKLLPWIARRYGLPTHRADELWRQSVSLADFRYGRAREHSDYWGYAIQSLLKLAACEGTAIQALEERGELALAAGTCPLSALPIVHAQRRMGTLAFDAATAFVAAANQYWRRALRAPRVHH